MIKRNIILLFFFLFVLLGSKAYKPNPYKPSPFKPSLKDEAPKLEKKPSDKNYQYNPGDPFPKKEKELKELIFSLKRKGVTIHHFEFQQALFTLKGTYKKKVHLNKFIKRIKKHLRSTNKPTLKTKKSFYAGSTTNHYELTLENLF